MPVVSNTSPILNLAIKAFSIKPDLHQTWYNQGIALGKLGRDEDAIASFYKALEIKPDRPYQNHVTT